MCHWQLYPHTVSDRKHNTSRKRGTANTVHKAVKVRAMSHVCKHTSSSLENVRCLWEDSVCCTTSKYGSHTSLHTGNMGTLLTRACTHAGQQTHKQLSTQKHGGHWYRQLNSHHHSQLCVMVKRKLTLSFFVCCFTAPTQKQFQHNHKY